LVITRKGVCSRAEAEELRIHREMRGEQQREVKSQIREVLKWTKEGTGASKTSNKMDNPGICGTGKMYEKKNDFDFGQLGC